MDVDPKLVERWASIYVTKLIKQGPDVAKEWATRFLKPEHVPEVAEKVKVKLKARGMKT